MDDTVYGDEREIREMVGLFDDRARFDAAVRSLLAAGFSRADLSVLSGHQGLDAVEPPSPPRDDAMSALMGELSYAFPLTTAGLIAIVGGPITATVAAVVAAGVGGAAIKHYLDELTAHPDVSAFEEALRSGGLILWVRTPTAELEQKAGGLLEKAGGRNIHRVERPPQQ